MLIAGAFPGVAGSRMCGTWIDYWCNAKVKGTRVKGVSATHPKKPGKDTKDKKSFSCPLLLCYFLPTVSCFS